MTFDVRDGGALPGLAEILAIAPGEDMDDAALSRYDRNIAAADLPLLAMSVFGDLRHVVERMQVRRLLREGAEERCLLPWFECHVPPGGSTRVRASAKSETADAHEMK